MTVWRADFNQGQPLSLYSLCLLITTSESYRYSARSPGKIREIIVMI